MASGFGRGGRGAALLKLLEQTPRLPGEQATPTNDTPQQVIVSGRPCDTVVTFMLVHVSPFPVAGSTH